MTIFGQWYNVLNNKSVYPYKEFYIEAMIAGVSGAYLYV